MAKYCKDCLHRYICDYRTRQDKPIDCKDWLFDRTIITTERAFYDELKKHLCSYDLPNYHSFKAIEEETLDDIAKEFSII